MVKKNSIPERWRSLKPVGQRVPGSRFIAFKVPLKGATSQRVTQNQKFTPKDLINGIKSQNEELGLIIDLTNTERYYTTKDLPKSVQYVKLHTAGLKIPDDATIHQFKRVVRRFLFAHEDDDKIIGVHCTTGINRTGYLVCRYLVDLDGWQPLHAISAFSQARGHAIEGSVYIEDLIKGPQRSNVGIDLPPTDEETRALALASGLEELPRDRPRSILDPANEFGDFDARGQRSRDRPGGLPDDLDDPTQNILGDHDLRLPQARGGFMEGGPRRMHPVDRFGRPDPRMDGRFPPPNRRPGPPGPPRPLMDFGPRMMQRPYEGDDIDYDLRGGGGGPGQNPMYAGEDYEEDYSDPYQPQAYNQMPNAMYEEEEEEGYEEEYYEEEEEDPGYDAGPQMGGPFQGPGHARMNPNARPMGGPMANRMQPRDPRFMNQPPRNARPMNPAAAGRGNAGDDSYMEGPSNSQYYEECMNNRMNPRDPRGMKGYMNEGDYSGAEGPMNKRMHPNAGRMNQGDGQGGPMGQRNAGGKPMYNRMQMQDSGAMDDSMNNQGYPSDGSQMYQRNTKSFDNNRSYQMNAAMNNRMPQRAPDGSGQMYQGAGGPMGNRMHQRNVQAQEGSMNDWMPETGAMEGPMHNKFAMNKPRPADGPMHQDFTSDENPYDGRSHNASNEAVRGPNRFAPYPARKPPQGPDSAGPPRNDPYNMGNPAYENVSYPLNYN